MGMDEQPRWSKNIRPASAAGRVLASLEFEQAWETFSKALVRDDELWRELHEVAPALIVARKNIWNGINSTCFLHWSSDKLDFALSSLTMLAYEYPAVALALAPCPKPNKAWWNDRKPGDFDGHFVAELARILGWRSQTMAMKILRACGAFEGLWQSQEWVAMLCELPENPDPQQPVSAWHEAALGTRWQGPKAVLFDDWRALMERPALVAKLCEMTQCDFAKPLQLESILEQAAAPCQDPQAKCQSLAILLNQGLFDVAEVEKALRSTSAMEKSAPIVACLEDWLMRGRTPSAGPAPKARL